MSTENETVLPSIYMYLYWSTSQMAPYSLFSVLLLCRAHNPWSEVVHYKVNMVPFGMQALHYIIQEDSLSATTEPSSDPQSWVVYRETFFYLQSVTPDVIYSTATKD